MYRDPDDDAGARIVTRLVLVVADDMAPPPAVPATLRAAARVPGVRGRDLAVLIELHEHLSACEWRVVRVWYVARSLGVRRQTVTAALRRLSDAGLVERSGAPSHMRYRLAGRDDLAA